MVVGSPHDRVVNRVNVPSGVVCYFKESTAGTVRGKVAPEVKKNENFLMENSVVYPPKAAEVVQKKVRPTTWRVFFRIYFTELRISNRANKHFFVGFMLCVVDPPGPQP